MKISIKTILLTLVLVFLSGQVKLNAQQVDTAKITSLVKVKGLTCAMDAKRIAENVEVLEGVETCNIFKFGATTKFKITYSPLKVKETEIYGAIEGTSGCEDPKDRPYKVKL